MEINNNDFFGEIKKDEFEEEAVSNSGINYGETANKSSLRNILITIGAAAVAAGVVVLLMSPNKKTTTQNNLAEIPTISPSEPIKIVPENNNINEVFENASIYNPTNFDDEAKNLITADKIVKPAPTVKPVPTKIIKTPVVKKINGPVLKEKSTDIKGETEVSAVKTAKAQTGIWNVQITSTSSENAANKEWTSLVSKHPDLLKELTHAISKTELNGKSYYRLRITNLEMNRANEICTKLKAKKVSCFVTK